MFLLKSLFINSSHTTQGIQPNLNKGILLLFNMIDTINSVHGHEVMNMMVESDKTYTKESLADDIRKKFGEKTVFYTCSAENMSAEQIVDFLEKKGKFINSEKGFTTDKEKICNH